MTYFRLTTVIPNLFEIKHETSTFPIIPFHLNVVIFLKGVYISHVKTTTNRVQSPFRPSSGEQKKRVGNNTRTGVHQPP